MKIRWSLWLPLALFLGFGALAAVQLLRPADRAIQSAMVGKPLPNFDLPPASASRPGLKTADFQDGQPKLLNVFASWCIPCAVEAPQIAALEQQGIPVVAVAIRDRPADVEAFLTRYGNPFARIGKDDLSELQLGIGSSGVPETFVIDGRGIIRYQHIGEIREPDVELLAREWRKAAR